MMFVLDTNVVSELRKVRLGKADANVAAWAQSVDAADLFGYFCPSPKKVKLAKYQHIDLLSERDELVRLCFRHSPILATPFMTAPQTHPPSAWPA